MEPEKRRCNECGEEWPDSGDYECPHCGSQDTFIVEEEEPGYKLVLLDPNGYVLNTWEDVQEWDLVDGPAELATWLYNNEIGEL